MILYKIKIKPHSRWQTPLFSDTLAGFMMWMIKFNTERFNQIHNRFAKGDFPFALSDGFPGDSIMMPAIVKSRIVNLTKKNPVIEGISNIDFIPREMVWQIIEVGDTGITFDLKLLKKLAIDQGNLPQFATDYESRVAIDRRTNNPLSNEHRLLGAYELKNTDFITIYALIDGEEMAKLLEDQFKNLEYHGFGRGSSSGFGKFYLDEFCKIDSIFEQKLPENHPRICLSHIIPKSGEKIPDYFEYFVKRGHVGEKGFGINKFESSAKKPIMMLKSGATYIQNEDESDASPRIIGNVVDKITDIDSIIQIGCGILI